MHPMHPSLVTIRRFVNKVDGPLEGPLLRFTAYGADSARHLLLPLSVTYIPSTGTESRKLTVDVTKFSRPIIARWYNPAVGAWKNFQDTPLPNRDSHSFVTPGDNGTRANDWLLVLEVR